MPRYSGPSLVARTPRGTLKEALRKDVCDEVRRFLVILEDVPASEVTWEVKR